MKTNITSSPKAIMSNRVFFLLSDFVKDKTRIDCKRYVSLKELCDILDDTIFNGVYDIMFAIRDEYDVVTFWSINDIFEYCEHENYVSASNFLESDENIKQYIPFTLPHPFRSICDIVLNEKRYTDDYRIFCTEVLMDLFDRYLVELEKVDDEQKMASSLDNIFSNY